MINPHTKIAWEYDCRFGEDMVLFHNHLILGHLDRLHANCFVPHWTKSHDEDVSKNSE
jgi:hypothetical protein